MRPREETRIAVITAIRSGPCTLLDAAQRSQVGYHAARYTIQNAMRSGEVQICGHERRAHAKRWLAIYEMTDAEPEEGDCAAVVDSSALVAALSCWSRFPCL